MTRSGHAFRENRLRPPGAVEEERFMALCIRCNRCLEVCPYGSIQRAGWGLTIGTPFVLPESKACYLCMACTSLCPTGALDGELAEPDAVRMGKATIDTGICYSHLFFDEDVLPEDAGDRIGALCNTCYNVCPLPNKAIMLKNNLLPVVLEGCVGCGICVERCPTRPRRAINVLPAGMGKTDEAGFHFRKARKHYEEVSVQGPRDPNEALKGTDLLERKQEIDGSASTPDFDFPYELGDGTEDWE